jgi:hypothetical protein
MFHDAGIEGDFCKDLWAECASTATFYDNIIVKKEQNKSPLELMFKENAKELRRLAAAKTKIQGKLSDRGSVCVFVGYPNNHANDVYMLLNLKTNHIMKSRDVVRSNKTYGEWMKSKDNSKMTDDDLSDTEVDADNHKEQKEPESPAKRNETDNNKQALKHTSKLKSWFNPDPSRFMEVQDSGRDWVVESANIAFNTLDLVEEPKTFDEAYNHPNTNDRILWKEAISKEFNEMSAKGVWKKILMSELPNSRNCIKSK